MLRIKEKSGDNYPETGGLLTNGMTESILREVYGEINLEDKLPKDWNRQSEVLDFDLTSTPTWIENPGGIPQNVLSKLPRLIHIPAVTESKELESDDKKYPLGECLSLLFEDLLLQSKELTSEIQGNLGELERQMNPKDKSSLVHQMITEVNTIISEVFPGCGINVLPSLQQLLEILKPKYDITIYSNIHTPAPRQGTGLIRTIIFSMLRYHARLKLQKEIQTRPIIIAFEEPELFLHPAAANLLRDTIYALGQSDQIICTTHSPWMINLSENPQSITRMYIDPATNLSNSFNFGLSAVLNTLDDESRDRIKMIQLFDDELSRAFFVEKVIIVEGDSEQIAIRNTLKLLPEAEQNRINSQYHVVKARGKPSILPLIRYLKSLSVKIRVVHDLDETKKGAKKFNEPIRKALNSDDDLFPLSNNLEEALGYTAPDYDKPFTCHLKTNAFKSFDALPNTWQNLLKKIFEVA